MHLNAIEKKHFFDRKTKAVSITTTLLAPCQVVDFIGVHYMRNRINE